MEEMLHFVVVQSFSHVRFFVTPWTAAHQASLSFTISQSVRQLMSIELVMPSNHLVLCCPLPLLPSIFLSIRDFLMSRLFASGGQTTGASASVSVLLMNIQDWFPLGLASLISLLPVQFSRSVVSDSLWLHGLQHTRPPCPSASPGVYSNLSIESLLSKGLSRVFPSTTVQKFQFFGVQPSLWSNFHISTWLL